MIGIKARADVVLWKQLDGCGMEHCRVSQDGAGAAIAGAVVTSSGGVPWRIEYDVRCDEAWRTRTVTIQAQAGETDRALALERDADGRWTAAGERRPDLDGCVDVDLGFSPSTNTLPIRRLQLGAGRSATIDAAWVEFPTLAIHRVPQRYTRVEDRTYRYENLPTGFAADVIVDGTGIVVSYPPGWERVHAGNADSLLFADARAPELDDAVRLYDALVGGWDVDVIDYDKDGTTRTTPGEWHFGLALEGRAVQDVFIVPARAQRSGGAIERRGNRYGTTVRFYDPARKAWRLVWINPVSGAVNNLVARKDGDAIVQEGADEHGMLMRWSFVDIERDRFHWIGEESNDGGSTWQVRAEFFARRASFAPLR